MLMVNKPRHSSQQVGARFRRERQAQGMSLRELARRLGTDPNIISRLETGKRQMSVEWLSTIADALGIRPAEFLETSPPEEHVMVSASVRLDQWLEDCWYDDANCYLLRIPADERHAGTERIAVVVDCSSMNLRYPEGTILICVPLEKLEGGIEVDKRYLIRSRRLVDGKQQDQLSVKTLVMGEDNQLRFVTESDDPDKTRAVPAFGTPDQEIRPIALVIGSIQPE